MQQNLNYVIKAEKNKSMIEDGFVLIKNFEDSIKKLVIEDIPTIEKMIIENKNIANDIQSSLIMTMVRMIETQQDKLITDRGNVAELPEETMLHRLNQLSNTEKKLHSSQKSLKKITNKILEKHDDALFFENQVSEKLEEAEDIISYLDELFKEVESKIKLDSFGGTKEETTKILQGLLTRASNVSNKSKELCSYIDEIDVLAMEQPFEKLNVKEQKENEVLTLETIHEKQLKPIQKQVDDYNENGIIVGTIKEEKYTNEECITLYEALNKSGYTVQRFEETVKKHRKQDIKTTKLSDLPLAGESLKNKYGIFIVAINDNLGTKKVNNEYFGARTFQGDSKMQKLIQKGVHIQKKCVLSIYNKKVLHTYDEKIKSTK